MIGLQQCSATYSHCRHKSADWPGNRPYPPAGWTAAELAKLLVGYITGLDAGMTATFTAEMPSITQTATCRWLPEAELAVYAA